MLLILVPTSLACPTSLNYPPRLHFCVAVQVRSTEENLTLANHWLTDSARLRKVGSSRRAGRNLSELFSNTSSNTLLWKKLIVIFAHAANVSAQGFQCGAHQHSTTHYSIIGGTSCFRLCPLIHPNSKSD